MRASGIAREILANTRDGPVAPVQGVTRTCRLDSAKSAELSLLESDAFAVAAIVKATTNVAGMKIS